MRLLINCCLAMAILLLAAGAAQAQTGVICGFPRDCVPAYSFKSYELPFSTGRQATFKSGDYAESEYFYAVVLDSINTVEATEGDYFYFNEIKRRAAQRLFPKNKVFASRCCGDGGELRYEGIRDDYNFIAVHGGATEQDAAKLLSIAKQKYPSAEIRRMRVVLDFRSKQN